MGCRRQRIGVRKCDREWINPHIPLHPHTYFHLETRPFGRRRWLGQLVGFGNSAGGPRLSLCLRTAAAAFQQSLLASESLRRSASQPAHEVKNSMEIIRAKLRRPRGELLKFFPGD